MLLFDCHFERNGTLYLTLSTLTGIDEGEPATTPIGFILTEHQLVTVRYADPRPFRLLAEHWKRDRGLASDGGHMFVRLVDSIVDRLCRAFFYGEIGDRELMAARLAAEQVRVG